MEGNPTSEGRQRRTTATSGQSQNRHERVVQELAGMLTAALDVLPGLKHLEFFLAALVKQRATSEVGVVPYSEGGRHRPDY